MNLPIHLKTPNHSAFRLLAGFLLTTAVAASAADSILEVETFALTNTVVKTLAGASDKVVAFEENSQAVGKVQLEKGTYTVTVFVKAQDSEHDALNVSFNKKAPERVFADEYTKISPCGELIWSVETSGEQLITLSYAEPGVLVDKILITKAP